MTNSSFTALVAAIAQEVADTLTKKHHDYGSFNIIGFPLGGDVFLAVQAWNKVTRILNLMHREPTHESLADSWLDLAGYAILGLMLERGLLDPDANKARCDAALQGNARI